MRDKYIFRLDVPMNDGSLMEIVNSTSDFIKNSPYFIDFRYLGGNRLVYPGLDSALLRHILDDFLP